MLRKLIVVLSGWLATILVINGLSAQPKKPSTASDKTRDQRKSTTKADAKSGNIKDAGEASGMKDEKVSKGSETTKDARKAQTKSDQKNKQIPGAGEAGSDGKTKQ